jgi:hypothetical protein
MVMMEEVCYPETSVLLYESQILNNCTVIQSIFVPVCVEVMDRKVHTFFIIIEE